MVVETTKNQIVLNKIVGQKRENRQVETDVIVNDVKPDVLKVINTNGVISIYKKDVMDGKILKTMSKTQKIILAKMNKQIMKPQE